MNYFTSHTIVELCCDEALDDGIEFHCVFTRYGLPWILSSLDGVRVEQVPGEENSIHNVVTVKDYHTAYAFTEHFMLSGWSLRGAFLEGSTIIVPSNLLDIIKSLPKTSKAILREQVQSTDIPWLIAS